MSYLASTSVTSPVPELRLVPDLTKEMAVKRFYIFNAVLRREGEWVTARCSEMPEAVSQGRDEAEALRNLKEAIACILEDEAGGGVEVNPDDLVIESSMVVGSNDEVAEGLGE
ncbi:MAG: type II toxin-antitoxin system HicB family antitoxin [Conexivisphaera sp.]